MHETVLNFTSKGNVENIAQSSICVLLRKARNQSGVKLGCALVGILSRSFCIFLTVPRPREQQIIFLNEFVECMFVRFETCRASLCFVVTWSRERRFDFSDIYSLGSSSRLYRYVLLQ